MSPSESPSLPKVGITLIIANCSISQLKRKIESEFYELHSKSLLIKVLEDSRGFIFSNNSLIGDHVQNGDTIYIVVHDSKEGANMNLPSNVTDIFLTLRFVCKSVVKKLSGNILIYSRGQEKSFAQGSAIWTCLVWILVR